LRVSYREGKSDPGGVLQSLPQGRAIYDPLHYLPVLARKPGARRNGAPLKDWNLPLSMRRAQCKFGRMPNGD
jgi:hypothetical protein